MSQPTAFVYVELRGVPRLVGRLFVTPIRGRGDGASFLYDPEWAAAPDRFALEPALTVSSAPHYTAPGRALFGALGDSAPDRWGQTLIRRDERARARLEGRAPRTIREIDFLLGVTDTVRQGALRFAETLGGPFVAPDKALGVPPLVELPRLLAATERFLTDEETAADLRLLLAPGSSLGGARPKASIRDIGGALMIAKFPKKGDDEYRVVAWEAVALRLAAASGIMVTGHRLEQIAGSDVLLVNRFDRRTEEGVLTRVPFLSAMSMLGASDGEARTYPEIADALRRHGASARQDLRELFRRMVFSVLISNTDDHLRNHGFLYDGQSGWRLSPAYDLNPVPVDIKPRQLSTALSLDGDTTASLDIAYESAEFFSLDLGQARAVAAEVGAAVATWRSVAARLGIANAEIERMASAFEHEDLAAARGARLS